MAVAFVAGEAVEQIVVFELVLTQYVVKHAGLEQQVADELGLVDVAGHPRLDHPLARLFSHEAILVGLEAIGAVTDFDVFAQLVDQHLGLHACAGLLFDASDCFGLSVHGIDTSWLSRTLNDGQLSKGKSGRNVSPSASTNIRWKPRRAPMRTNPS